MVDRLLMQYFDVLILLRCILMFPPAIGASAGTAVFIVVRDGIAALRTRIRYLYGSFPGRARK
jgi:hypothetical protein